MKLFDRSTIHYLPLRDRKNKVDITRDSVRPASKPKDITEEADRRVDSIAREIIDARRSGSSVICAFGAHTIKNGLGPLLGEFIAHDWLTHLATNGAGVIHDWEFSYQGVSSEDVRKNVQTGSFGTWEETGLYINLAILVGAWEGLGYGESVGAMIHAQGLAIPVREELKKVIAADFSRPESPPLWKRAAAADLLDIVVREDLASGFLEIDHPYRKNSIQWSAFTGGTPFTSHPMFGHDIIYTHRVNSGAAIGRSAERDFLSYVRSVSNLEGGVYLSIGSAVMSPMIFEKSLSMARNAALREGKEIKNCHIHVVDLQEESWDWTHGEPPIDNPAYYLRFMKTFNRMGCPVDYTSMDNRSFLLHLFRKLASRSGETVA